MEVRASGCDVTESQYQYTLRQLLLPVQSMTGTKSYQAIHPKPTHAMLETKKESPFTSIPLRTISLRCDAFHSIRKKKRI